MNIRVLVGEVVARQREQEPDIALQLRCPRQAIFRRHLAGVIGGLHPVHDRDFFFHRVVRHLRAGGKLTVADAAVARCPTAFYADVTGDGRQQRGATGGALAADMALRPPSLD